MLSPTPLSAINTSAPSSPVSDTPQTGFEDVIDWSFLPRYSSALGVCTWGYGMLGAMAKRVAEFISWGENTADAIRIAMGIIRERIVKATLVAWKDGTPPMGLS